MKNRILTVLTVLLVAGTAGIASGVTVYQDSFDNVAVGAFPSPQVGTWVLGGAIVGQGAASPPSIPNYMDNDRNVGGAGSHMYGDLDGATLGAGAVIHAEYMCYNMASYNAFGLNVDATNPYPWDPTTGDACIVVYGSADGGTVYVMNSAGGGQASGLTHQLDTWELWEIDWVVGATSYTLTIGGNSLTTSVMKDPGATQVGALFFGGFSGATRLLVDDVLVTPEPATLAVLSLGLIAALIRRRR